MEYERYLEYERFPLRQQQHWEKKQAAQKKVQTKHTTPTLAFHFNTVVSVSGDWTPPNCKCYEQFKSSQKNTSDEVATAPADHMLTSQAYYNQERWSNLTYTQSPCLRCLHPQSWCPVNAPSQPYQLQQLASLTGQNDKAWLSQNAPDQASLQADQPLSWLAGNQSATDAVWTQTNSGDACAEEAALQAETSGESRSHTERCTSRSSRSHLSLELDDKPGRRKRTTV